MSRLPNIHPTHLIPFPPLLLTPSTIAQDALWVHWNGYRAHLSGIVLRVLQVEKDRVWTFEQPQTLAFTNVTTSIRMTVVRLSNGGLFVYSPVAPTRCALGL